MSLSCSCDEWDPDPNDVVYHGYESNHKAFSMLYPFKRGRKCISACGRMLKQGDEVWAIPRMKMVETGADELAELPRAPHYLCERCGNIYLSLIELEYCISPNQDMGEMLRDYQDTHGEEPKP